MDDNQTKIERFYSIIMYLVIYSKIRMVLQAKVDNTIFSRTITIWKNNFATGPKLMFNSNKRLKIHAIPFDNYQLLKTNTNYINPTIPLVLRDYFSIKLFNLVYNNEKLNLIIKYAQNSENMEILESKKVIQYNSIKINQSNFSDLFNFPTGNWAFNFDGGQFKIPAFHGSLIANSLFNYKKDIKLVPLHSVSGRNTIKNISPRYYILKKDLPKFTNNFNLPVIANFQNMVKDIPLYKKCKENQLNYKKFKENV